MASARSSSTGEASASLSLVTSLGAGLLACGLVGCDERPAKSWAPGMQGTPLEIVAAIVKRTHGNRAGGFDRVALELREAASSAPVAIRASLPSLIKITWPDGRWALARDDEVRGGINADDDRIADDTLRATAITMRGAIDALCLGPLTRAARAERLDDDTLRVIDRDGTTFELDYDRQSAAVIALRSGVSEMRVVEDLDRGGISRIFLRVAWTGLGERFVRFLDTGLEFDANSFVSPKSRQGVSGPSMVVGGPRPTLAPRLTRADPVRWLMQPDPGDWPARMSLFHAAGARLGPLGYGNGGDPMLVRQDDADWFVVPFVAVETDARPVVTTAGERVMERARERIAQAETAPGAWPERIEQAKRSLEAFLQERNLAAIGEVRLVLNLVGNDPGANPDCLTDLPVRLVIPVR